MAAFVEDGARIPRRGEIGMQAEQIEKFETVGYVMSGSRHKRMNAVRVRKENQVISAEEKRGILHLQAQEKAKRENEVSAKVQATCAPSIRADGGMACRRLWRASGNWWTKSWPIRSGERQGYNAAEKVCKTLARHPRAILQRGLFLIVNFPLKLQAATPC